MTEQAMTYYVDRSGAELDAKCPRAFWWNRIAANGGVVPAETPIAYRAGIDVHVGLAAIARLENPLEIAATLEDVSPDARLAEKEERIRLNGWLLAFARYIEPLIRKTYETVAIEHEIALDRDPLVMGVTPDRLLRHREGGYLVYLDYKSARFISANWMASWNYSIQLHTVMLAVEEEMGEPVKFAQVMGLVKGDRRVSAEGYDYNAHPYVWAYRNSATGSWTHEYAKARSAGWEHRPVWEYPEGIDCWVERLGEEVARGIFPFSQPVFLNRSLVEDWLDARRYREEEIELWGQSEDSDELFNLTFPQRPSQCVPAFGDPCAYRLLCHNAAVGDQAAVGELHPDFVRRTPHHDLEWML